MRTLYVVLIALSAALLGAAVTLTAQKQVAKSTVFEWTTLEAKSTRTGARRDVGAERRDICHRTRERDDDAGTAVHRRVDRCLSRPSVAS